MQIKSTLHEPVSSYLTHSYNMVTQLVQSVNLAALFFVISIQQEFNLLFACKVIVLLLLICLIWHSYIYQDQFISWRPRKRDTITPIFFFITQSILTVTINQPIFIFALFFTLVPIVGFFGYYNPYTGYKQPDSLKLFKEHFKGEGEEFAENFHSELMSFDKQASKNMASVALILGLTTVLFFYTQPFYELIKSYLFIVSCGLIIIALLHFDMKYYLTNSQRLQKYGYNW